MGQILFIGLFTRLKATIFHKQLTVSFLRETLEGIAQSKVPNTDFVVSLCLCLFVP